MKIFSKIYNKFTGYYNKSWSGFHFNLIMLMIVVMCLMSVTVLYFKQKLQRREYEINYNSHLRLMEGFVKRTLVPELGVDIEINEETARERTKEHLSIILSLIPEIKSIVVYKVNNTGITVWSSHGNPEKIDIKKLYHLKEYADQSGKSFYMKELTEQKIAFIPFNVSESLKGVMQMEFFNDVEDYHPFSSNSNDILLMTILGILFNYFLLYFFLLRNVIRPSQAILEAVNDMSGGRMSTRVEVQGHNEIWKIGMAFNSMAEAMEYSLNMEKTKVRELHVMNEAVSELTAQTEMKLLIHEITRHARNLIKSDYGFLYMVHKEESGALAVHIAEFEGYPESFSVPPEQIIISGLIEKVLVDAEFIQINNITEETIGLPDKHPPLNNLLVVPLVLGGAVVGLIGIANKKNSEYSPQDEDFLFTFAIQAMMAVDRMVLFEETKRLSVTDGLTGLMNHREFQRQLDFEVGRGLRYNRNLSLLLLDIDFFKTFNDTYGHQFGDKVLKTVSGLIKLSLRTNDFAARYGGEEFAVILPETDKEVAISVAERIRERVAGHEFIFNDKQKITLTISIGIASMPVDARTREKLIAFTDQALYCAKETGRNKVCDYSKAVQSGIFISGKKINKLIEKSDLELLENLAEAVDARSSHNKDHTKKVTENVLMMAEYLALSDNEKEDLKLASVLHDIGTLSVPETILSKPGPLNTEELKIVQAHPGLVEMMFAKSKKLEKILPAILYHHERYDGKGYPNGLKGGDIPLNAKILGIAEAYAAMTSPRPYRQAMSSADAIALLRQNAGMQFDPEIVEQFINAVEHQLSDAKLKAV